MDFSTISNEDLLSPSIQEWDFPQIPDVRDLQTIDDLLLFEEHENEQQKRNDFQIEYDDKERRKRSREEINQRTSKISLEEPKTKKMHHADLSNLSENYQSSGLSLQENLGLFCSFLEKKGVIRENLHEFITGKKMNRFEIDQITGFRAMFKREIEMKMIIKGSTKRGNLKEVGNSGLLTLDINNNRMKNYCFRWEGIDPKFLNANYSFIINFDFKYVSLVNLFEKTEIGDLKTNVVTLKHGNIKEKCKKIRCQTKEVVVVLKKEKIERKQNAYESHVCFKMPKIGESGIIYPSQMYLLIGNKHSMAYERVYVSQFCFRKNGNKCKKHKETFNKLIKKMECIVYQKLFFL